MSTPIVRQPVGFVPHKAQVEVEIGVDETGVVKSIPSRAMFFKALNRLAAERDGEWAGLPVPLPGLGLVVEDRHPRAAQIAELQRITDEHEEPPGGRRDHTCDDDALGWRSVNSWRGRTKAGLTGTIHVLRHEDGRTAWTIDPEWSRRNHFIWGPFETIDAWTLDAELTAVDRLATLLSERMFKAYILTGSFLETSKRSGVSYLFRRLRPTVAMTFRSRTGLGDEADDAARVLACLCLHPVAYYSRTFCGAMVPTDDVIAHLLLMRGDEHLYWKRANHHDPLDPESGM